MTSDFNKKDSFKAYESSKATELTDISYGVTKHHFFDLYLPENRSESSTKVIVLLHGGGWKSGDKNDMNAIYDYFKTSGNNYAVAKVNYTLADTNTKPVPTQINDIKLFIDYIKSNFNNYNVAPEFVFIGVSAGAYLAMLYAYAYDQNQSIKAIGNIVGPIDFLHPSYLETTVPQTLAVVNNVETLFGLPIKENKEYYESVSPIYQIKNVSPPTISFYGSADLLAPKELGVKLKTVLDSKHVINDYVLYEGKGHGWGNPELLDTLKRIESFLNVNVN